MKVINLASKQQESEQPGLLDGLQERLRRSLSNQETRAQDTAIQRLGRVLDARFTLLHNLVLEGAPADLPVMLLAGPPGLWILHASALRGLYRASEGQWESMAGHGKNYRPARPNLIEQVQAAGQAMSGKLESLSVPVPPVETALLFVDPGAHVEMVRPAVRIVQADALERFAAGLLKADIILGPDVLRRIADSLARAQWAAPELELTPDASFADLEGRLPNPSAPPEPSRLARLGADEPEFMQKIGKRAAFTRRQWTLLGILLVVNFVILVCAILFAVATLR